MKPRPTKAAAPLLLHRPPSAARRRPRNSVASPRPRCRLEHLFLASATAAVAYCMYAAHLASLGPSSAGGGGRKLDVPRAAATPSPPKTRPKRARSDGAVFTPESFASGDPGGYFNLPVLPTGVTPEENRADVARAMERRVDRPSGLLHAGSPPGRDALVGLAAWPRAMRHFVRLVGSARSVGYDGHILLGVHAEIPEDEREYLRRMDVTFYAVDLVQCEGSGASTGDENVVRGKCSRGMESLKLEWGRFEMARQWLRECKGCTGWALVMDTRDVFFQAHPFKGMPPPDSSPYDLLFIEEISKHSCPKEFGPARYYTVDSNVFYRGHKSHCYGEWHTPLFGDRPILCAGTIVGNKKGIDRFLAVFVDEFIKITEGGDGVCRSSTSDQAILQWMYYTGKFSEFERTRTSPWGTGPINTIGHPCVDNTIPDPNKRHSAKDIVKFDNSSGLILNVNEDDRSEQRVSPVVHQYDRCHSWVEPFLGEHRAQLFGIKEVPWLGK